MSPGRLGSAPIPSGTTSVEDFFRESRGRRPGTGSSRAATVERVLLIQRALVVGFSLADLTRVLAVRDKGGSPCVGVRALVGDRLEQLNQRIEELLALRDELRSLVADWDRRLANTPRGGVRTCSKRSAAGPLSSKLGTSGANADETDDASVVCRTQAGQMQDDNEQRESERDGADHIDPSRCAAGV